MKKNQSNKSLACKDDTEIKLSNGGVVRIEALSPYIFRFRLAGDGHFVEPGVIRYGVFPGAKARSTAKVKKAKGRVLIQTDGAAIEIAEADGTFVFYDAGGKCLVRSASVPQNMPRRGFSAELAIGPQEKFYGLGDVCRDRLNKRGHRAEIWVKNISSYIPIPWVMSTGGWALLVNSTWKHVIDIGQAQPDRLLFKGEYFDRGNGNLDFYLVAGESLPLLLDRYTWLAGRPALLPKWAYGFMFINREFDNINQVLENALHFRDRKIPCDSLGLEPGWMDNFYNGKVDKKWHPERFPIPSWVKSKTHSFVGVMDRLGFKLSLWLNCEYDVTYAEEKICVEKEDRQFHLDAQIHDERLLGQFRLDTCTQPNQSWFEHLKKFVDQGASAFKMDAHATVFEFPDRRWANGLDDLEMHNIYGLILNKQMHNGFAEYTGKRPMINAATGYAGTQQYSTCWAGDTGGGEKPLVCILNHSLSGNPNVSCDMDIEYKAGIHFGFFNPWSMVNNCYFWFQPWFLGEEIEAMARYYAQLRSRLIPYIYSTAYTAHLSGLPIVRPMPLAFPDDPKSDELLKQFMFGDAFLVAAFTDQVHLPEGKWFDLWSGQCHEGPCDLTCQVPEDRGGPAFVRAGSIIPYGPVMSHVDQKPMECVELHVYPCGSSRFTLFEDDGLTFGYQKGQCALTEIKCKTSPGCVELTILPRQGRYAGMPEKREYDLVIRLERIPRTVLLNRGEVPVVDGKGNGWRYETDSQTVCLKVSEDPKRKDAIEIVLK